MKKILLALAICVLMAPQAFAHVWMSPSGSISTHNSDAAAHPDKVVGPSSATDNAVPRYDGATGKLVQDSAVTIDDNANLTTNATLGANAVTIDATCTGWDAGGALLDCGAGNTNGWCCNASTSIQKIADGTTAVTYNTAEADGQRVRLSYTTAGIVSTVLASLGSVTVPDYISTNGTFVTTITEIGTGDLTFTPQTATRVVLSAVAVNAITGGVAEVDGFDVLGQIKLHFNSSAKYKGILWDNYDTGNATDTLGIWLSDGFFTFGDGDPATNSGSIRVQGKNVFLTNESEVLVFNAGTFSPYSADNVDLGGTGAGAYEPFNYLRLRKGLTTVDGTVPVASVCGTTPAVATGSSGVAGKITFGTTAGTPSACTLTWGVAFTNTPACTVTVVGAVDAHLRISAESNTAMTVTASGATDLSSTVFNYTCVGLNE